MIGTTPHRRVRMVRTRSVVALLWAGACLLATLTTSSPVHADVPNVANCTAAPTLGKGSIGPDVRCLQFALILYGYDAPYTGMFDDQTADALFWYQAARPPLQADGMAGPKTLESLGILAENAPPVTLAAFTCLADAHIKPFDSGRSVKCLQERLTELGLYRGPINGTNDIGTQMALLTFQRTAPPIAADGVAGPRTLAALGIWSGVTTAPGSSPAYSPGSPSSPATVVPGPWPASLQPEPFWNLTSEGLPVYGSRVPCTRAQADVIAAEFARDGADPMTQQWAVYIATREGGCRFDAVNINPATRDDSHCTFQINALAGTFQPYGELGRRGWTPENVKYSLSACADAASDLWVFCGRGPWEPPYVCRPPWRNGAVGLPADANIPTTTTTTTEPATDLSPDPPPITADSAGPSPVTTTSLPPSAPVPPSPPPTRPPDTTTTSVAVSTTTTTVSATVP